MIIVEETPLFVFKGWLRYEYLCIIVSPYVLLNHIQLHIKTLQKLKWQKNGMPLQFWQKYMLLLSALQIRNEPGDEVADRSGPLNQFEG